MISNGYKVIGIEENGNVEYDVMSSCPVSPSKPTLNGSSQKTINEELQKAIKQLLLSNRPMVMETQRAPTVDFDADFAEILKRKGKDQLEAAKQLETPVSVRPPMVKRVLSRCNQWVQW